MFKLLIRRFLLILPQIVILSFIVFFLSDAIPEMTWTLDGGTDMADAFIFNPNWQDTIFTRYLNWVGGIFTAGDFGWSWRLRMPAMTVVGMRLPNTIRLSLFTLFLVYGVGIPLGIISGRRSGTWKDRVIRMVTLIGSSLPSFTLAILLLFFLGFRLDLLPTSGSLPPGVSRAAGFAPYYIGRLRHLILPSLSLAIIQLIIPVKHLRGSIIDTEEQEFVTLARAKGANEKYLFKKHTLKNAITPLVSSFPIQLTTIVTSTIIIESIFNIPGIGELFLSAFAGNDTDLVNSLILVFGLIILLGSFISDVILMALDPRVKIEE